MQTQGTPLSLRRPDLTDDELLATLRKAWRNLDDSGEEGPAHGTVTLTLPDQVIFVNMARRDRKSTFKAIKRNNLFGKISNGDSNINIDTGKGADRARTTSSPVISSLQMKQGKM